ncbi:autotransporter outer membrane beta-barrel domain-containing protein [Aquamicrobium segne]|uniref:Autotransporter outer membrane beta-barrel domain-containing protein n=1 Tax=Aquamicrobium segne TaxID=469547 RepID=A0ABW0GZ91_9HYPH
MKTDNFDEIGGTAALYGASQSQDVTFSTLGLRGATDIQIGSISAVARGGIGWRHAFGAVTPLTTMAFSSGTAFDAKGTPIARDAVLIEGGIDINLTKHAVLGVSYQGQASSSAQEHGFNAKLNVRF